MKAPGQALRDLVKARTDAYTSYGIKEAIRRLNLYADAGADLLFADAWLEEDHIASGAGHIHDQRKRRARLPSSDAAAAAAERREQPAREVNRGAFWRSWRRGPAFRYRLR